MAACIVVLNRKMQRYICAFGQHNRDTLKGNCKRMDDGHKRIKSACHQWTGSESRKQVTEQFMYKSLLSFYQVPLKTQMSLMCGKAAKCSSNRFFPQTLILKALTLEEKKKNRNRFTAIKSWRLFKLAQGVPSSSADDTLGIQKNQAVTHLMFANK